ncbi:MAG TPA: hypothetical protein VHS97_02135 [Isosphaeraceae bacterium]|nr:hypothetical protein [Isosphaeraceae bacterium]
MQHRDWNDLENAIYSSMARLPIKAGSCLQRAPLVWTKLAWGGFLRAALAVMNPHVLPALAERLRIAAPIVILELSAELILERDPRFLREMGVLGPEASARIFADRGVTL